MLKGELTPETRKSLCDELLSWYYTDGGNGIFLSREARDMLTEAWELLVSDPPQDDQTKNAFSKVRLQLRRDIAVYGKELGTKYEAEARV